MIYKKNIKIDDALNDEFLPLESEDGLPLPPKKNDQENITGKTITGKDEIVINKEDFIDFELQKIDSLRSEADINDYIQKEHDRDVAEGLSKDYLSINGESNVELPSDDELKNEIIKERLRNAIKNKELAKLSRPDLAGAIELLYNMQPISSQDILGQEKLSDDEVYILLMEKDPILDDPTRLDLLGRLSGLLQGVPQKTLKNDTAEEEENNYDSELFKEVLTKFQQMKQKEFQALLMSFDDEQLTMIFEKIEKAKTNELFSETTQVELMQSLNSARIKKSEPFKILKSAPKLKKPRK